MKISRTYFIKRDQIRIGEDTETVRSFLQEALQVCEGQNRLVYCEVSYQVGGVTSQQNCGSQLYDHAHNPRGPCCGVRRAALLTEASENVFKWLDNTELRNLLLCRKLLSQVICWREAGCEDDHAYQDSYPQLLAKWFQEVIPSELCLIWLPYYNTLTATNTLYVERIRKILPPNTPCSAYKWFMIKEIVLTSELIGIDRWNQLLQRVKPHSPWPKKMHGEVHKVAAFYCDGHGLF